MFVCVFEGDTAGTGEEKMRQISSKEIKQQLEREEKNCVSGPHNLVT